MNNIYIRAVNIKFEKSSELHYSSSFHNTTKTNSTSIESSRTIFIITFSQGPIAIISNQSFYILLENPLLEYKSL